MQTKTITYILIILLVIMCPLMYFVGNFTAPKTTVTLTLSGSTTVFPIGEAWGAALEDMYPFLSVQVSAGGSGVGIQQVGQNLVDIGMASRQVKASELVTYPNLINHTVALDGIALVVNPGLAGKITNMTLLQIHMIYNGTITNWNQINASLTSLPIVTAGRASTSGTYEFFLGHVMLNDVNYAADATFDANAGVQAFVQITPYSIGYVGMGYLTGVSVVKINDGGILKTPSVASVQSGDYPIWRPLFLVTNGPIVPGSLTELFINFALGSTGQAIVLAQDYVPLP
jgi:phosphate transport system substrate-binding protein